MKRIEGPHAVNGRFVQGTLEQTKTPMTVQWLNSVQEEICNIIESEEIELDPQNTHQLSHALSSQFSRASPSLQINERAIERLSLDDVDLTANYHTNAFKTLTQILRPGQTHFSARRLRFKFSSEREIAARFFVRITYQRAGGPLYRDFLPYCAQFTRGPSKPFDESKENPERASMIRLTTANYWDLSMAITANIQITSQGPVTMTVNHDTGRLNHPMPSQIPAHLHALLKKDLSLAPSWQMVQDTGFHCYSYLTDFIQGNTSKSVPTRLVSTRLVMDPHYRTGAQARPISLMIARDGQFYLIGDHVENHDANYEGRIDIVDMKKIPPYPQ